MEPDFGPFFLLSSFIFSCRLQLRLSLIGCEKSGGGDVNPVGLFCSRTRSEIGEPFHW